MAGYAAGDSILLLEAQIRREVSANWKTSATTSEEMRPVCSPGCHQQRGRVAAASIPWPDQADRRGSFGGATVFPGNLHGNSRRLAYEAADSGLLSADLAAGIRRVKGLKKLGVRSGNWLTAEQAQSLWQAPDGRRLKGKRDRALLALLLVCGLRRHEIAELRLDHLQQREGHWAIVDLIGKGRHVRTFPVPDWVQAELSAWVAAAGIQSGKLFRRVSTAGKIWGDGVSQKVVWHVVKEFAKTIGVTRLAPHDLRRTCARLCRAAGGELEQIQFLLGHVSVQATERYLGCTQRIASAVNDRIGIEPR
jgi:integrase